LFLSFLRSRATFLKYDSSCLSVNGVMDDMPMLKASPKRRKGDDSAPLPVGSSNETSIFKRKGGRLAGPSDQSIDGAESNRFEQLTMNDVGFKKECTVHQNLFLTLSTSPINHPDETPISKNTKKKADKMTVKTDMDEDYGTAKTDTPTPPVLGVQTDMTDEHTLNKHLRGQTFTPLPHNGESGMSPNNAAFSALAPSLSWSIAGDTPSLEDLNACSWEETDREERKRPGSTTSHTSSATRNMVISPHNFSLWKEEHESKKKDDEDMKDDGESIRLSMLSPNSEIVESSCGTTTPLPIFFRETGSDERENHHSDKKFGHGKDSNTKDMAYEHMQQKNMFMPNGPRRPGLPQFFSHGPPRDGLPPTPVFAGSKPPTPHYPGSAMNVGFARSPLHGDRRDYGHMFGHPPPGHHNDRIRNLRGRMPPGAHMAPMPIHIPPPMSSHHPLTSPMGLPVRPPPWSPHGMHPPMASPHHMSPIDMTQSKRKCVPLKPPIPSKFQGDMEKMKSASVPEFTSLVNFPGHMSQKQAVNLPDGMRCCVMCGSACPCSNGTKKKSSDSIGGKKDGGDSLVDKNGYAIIPTQNKGLCTLCDVNVWVVCTSGLEIKWCKGCKNFRPWASFGDKGLATKCLRCRERQREKYALQKEEKEKARIHKKTKV
jgi:hypothetical protein